MIQYTSLSNITIPQNIKIILLRTFENCNKLTNVEIPSNVKIPSNLTKIGKYAFSKNASLTSIDIPGSVKEIGWAAFEMTGLTSVEIPNSVTKIDHYAFYGCNSLIKVTFNLKAETSEDLKDYCNTLFEGSNQHINVYVPDESINTYTDWLANNKRVTININ